MRQHKNQWGWQLVALYLKAPGISFSTAAAGTRRSNWRTPSSSQLPFSFVYSVIPSLSMMAPMSVENVRRRSQLMTSGRLEESPLPRYFLVLVGIITIGGLVLRLPTFSDSLSGDEISTYFIVTGHSLGRVLRLVESNQEATPPLYFMLAWATKGLLGNPAQSIRLVSLVTGTAAIPLTFVLGMWTVGRRAALVGATCMACSANMIFYSTSARPFMLMLFLTLLSTLALVRVLDRGGLGWWVAYAACSCGAIYTHYTAVFLLFVQLVWAFWTQPQVRKNLIIANGAAVLAYIPWINGLREDLHTPNLIGAFVPFNLRPSSACSRRLRLVIPLFRSTNRLVDPSRQSPRLVSPSGRSGSS